MGPVVQALLDSLEPSIDGSTFVLKNEVHTPKGYLDDRLGVQFIHLMLIARTDTISSVQWVVAPKLSTPNQEVP